MHPSTTKSLSSSSSDPDCFFVTGAAGFIGANLLEKLASNNQQVHILLKKESNTWRINHLKSYPNLHFHYGTLLDKNFLLQLLQNIQPTVIYHLATRGAYSSQSNFENIFETNVIGTQNLLEASKDISYKLFINTTSSSEYGFKSKPMSENDPAEPDSFYAISKLAATHLCQLQAVQLQKPIVSFRLFSIYGPWEEPSRLIPKLLNALKKGNPIQMANPATGHDFVYVNDLVTLYLQVELLSKFSGQIFNLGTGVQTSLLELSEIAQGITGQTTQFEWQKMVARSWDKNTWVADTKKTQHTLNWCCTTNLASGLAQMAKWLNDHEVDYL